jgi:tetratricopeptide (TPR) repeat protein
MVRMFDHQLAEGENQFQAALGLNPNSPLVNSWRGILLSCQGRLDAALDAYEKASGLNPLWFTNLALYASRLFHARRYEAALEINQRAVSLRADIYMLNHGIQPQLLLAAGRTAEAVDAARFVRQRPELGPRWLADSIAVAVLRQVGLEQEASDYAAELFARWPQDSFHRGFVHGAFGRFDEALPFLERTPYMPAWWLFWDPMWDAWRDDPRFLQLITKLGRAAEYQVARATLARMLAEKPAKP